MNISLTPGVLALRFLHLDRPRFIIRIRNTYNERGIENSINGSFTHPPPTGAATFIIQHRGRSWPTALALVENIPLVPASTHSLAREQHTRELKQQSYREILSEKRNSEIET